MPHAASGHGTGKTLLNLMARWTLHIIRPNSSMDLEARWTQRVVELMAAFLPNGTFYVTLNVIARWTKQHALERKGTLGLLVCNRL